MKDVWNPNSYSWQESNVRFAIADESLQRLFDKAEDLCRKNIRQYNEFDVLIEGEKYNGVWMETQPMGGEMYAKRNIKAALSNILIFLRYQRRDGKFPGMIMHDNVMGTMPYYDWMQGLFLPYAALKLYYLIGREPEYLKAVYTALEDYDAFLWKYRDSDGDGCLETWCIWDTGEDNFTLQELNGINAMDHGAYGGIVPPENYGNLPYESPQYMAYSYAGRKVLSEISKLLQNGKEQDWADQAEAVRQKLKSYLWDEEKKACYPRDKDNQMLYCLTQENIKCMYEGIFDQEMADGFIREHLLNEEEFWTPYPIPSIAVNDPYFHVSKEYSNCYEQMEAHGKTEGNIQVNSWSGPVNGLTCQRSIEALLNYGHHAETVLLGRKIIGMLKMNPGFAQNYNPFTGVQHGDKDGYGPTMLTLLEYVSILYGVNYACDTLIWTGIEDAGDFTYTQTLLGDTYTLVHSGGMNAAYINGECVFTASANVRVKTDRTGEILAVYGLLEENTSARLIYRGKEYSVNIQPNEEISIENGEIKRVCTVDYKYGTK